MIQKPFERSEVAVVLKGGEGIGKGFLAKRLGDLVGREHYAQVSNSKNVFGDFNACLPIRCCCFATSYSPAVTNPTKPR